MYLLRSQNDQNILTYSTHEGGKNLANLHTNLGAASKPRTALEVRWDEMRWGDMTCWMVRRSGLRRTTCANWGRLVPIVINIITPTTPYERGLPFALMANPTPRPPLCVQIVIRSTNIPRPVVMRSLAKPPFKHPHNGGPRLETWLCQTYLLPGALARSLGILFVALISMMVT